MFSHKPPIEEISDKKIEAYLKDKHNLKQASLFE